MPFGPAQLRSHYDAEIAKLAIPALGSLVAEPLYVLADTAIVGNIGTTELAGLAFASTVLLTVHAAMIFLAYGTTGPVARMIGGGDVVGAAHRSLQGLWLAAILGIGSAAVMFGFGTTLLGWLGAEGAELAAAQTYLDISVLGFPFLLVTLAANGSFHGRQNATIPLALAAAGATINIVVELILIPGLGYGIGASALSTVIAQVLVGIVAAVLVVRWTRASGAVSRPNPTTMRALLGTSTALIVRTMSLRGSFTLSTAIAAGFGVIDVAAHQVAISVWITLALALDAVAIAGQSLTGKWLGIGDVERARAATRRMIEVDVAVGVVVGLLVIVFRQPLGNLFTDDPVLADLIAFALAHVGAQQPLNGVVFALDGILIGAGDLTFLAIGMVGAAIFFAVLCGVIVAAGLGLGWLWAAIAAFMTARAIPLVWRWRQDTWLRTTI